MRCTLRYLPNCELVNSRDQHALKKSRFLFKVKVDTTQMNVKYPLTLASHKTANILKLSSSLYCQQTSPIQGWSL